MKTRAIRTGFTLTALALAVSPAMATEIRFDGFASFVAGQVLDKDELASEAFHGYDERIDFQKNSLFAIQARADLQEKLSATAQIIAKGSEDYNARFNWAYLTYELSNELTVKAGRFRDPLFMFSDFLDVGYAYHWISPPESVYDLSGFDSSDGVMLQHQTDIFGWTSTATLTAARTSADVNQGTLESNNSSTVTWTMNYDWFTFHVAHSQSDITLDASAFDQIEEGLSGFGVSQEAIDNMLMESDRGAFDGIGVSIDTGKFFAIAEYTEIATADTFAADPSKQWYVTGGMRFGNWTAYATVENQQADIREQTMNTILAEYDQGVASMQGTQSFLATTITNLIASGNPALIAQVPALQANYNLLGLGLRSAPDLRSGVQAVFAQAERDEDTYSVGIRYNFHPSACAKLEYMEMDDHINEMKPSAISVAVDLVY